MDTPDAPENELPAILVVDDNETHHVLMRLMAQHLGVKVHCAFSCSHAFEVMSGNQFKLVLMDYKMPEEDGCDCAKRIRASDNSHKNVPIVAVTAMLHQTSALECLEAGMNDFLPKPFALEELQKKLQKHLSTTT